MDLEHLSPSPDQLAHLPTDLAAEMAEVRNAARSTVPAPAVTGGRLVTALAFRREVPVGTWLAREDGRLIGWMHLTHDTHDPEVALLRGAVLPSHQRQGVGRQLVEAALAHTDRPRVRARAFDGTAGEAALPHLGFTRGRSNTLGELVLASRDWATLSSPPEGYRFTRWVGSTPPGAMGDLAMLREAINDAPDIDGYGEYTPERIAEEDAATEASGITQYTVVAHRVISGQPAALTVVAVDDASPEVAVQMETAVLPEHRGHRLGTSIKADLAGWLRRERPDVRATHTWVDTENAAVLAVNRQLGVRRLAGNTVWELTR